MSDIPPSYNGPTSENKIPHNQTPAFKAARLAVIILSVLILLALVGLVVGAIRTMGGKHGTSHAATSTFQLAPGARITEMQSQPGRLILRVRDKAGEEIDILDTQDGRLVGQVKAPFSK